MPQVDIDGANSKVSADTIRGQSGTTVTVQSGHNLVGSGSGLTALPAANLTGTLPAISGASLTNLPAKGWVFLNSQTASGASSIDWTSTYVTSTYFLYMIIIADMVPSTGTDIHFLTSTDGGSSFDVGTSYKYVSDCRNEDGSQAGGNSGGTAQALIKLNYVQTE